MAKKNVTFFCKECGYETTGWMGKCPGCGSFNTLVESTTVTGSGKSSTNSKSDSPAFKASSYSWTDRRETVRLADAGNEEYIRFHTGIDQLDTLFGGGITDGSVTFSEANPA